MKKIILLVSILFIITGCTTCNDTKIGIISSNKSTEKLDHFKVNVVGGKVASISEDDLNKLDIYTIKANVDDNYALINKTFKAVKLSDVLNIVAPKNYATAEFISTTGTSLWLPSTELDDYYLAFNENQMIIACFNKIDYNWLYDLDKIDFTREGI